MRYKRLFDLIAALGAMVLLGPLCLLLTVLIFAVDGRPILFVSRRVGRDSKDFKILKFRSMRLRAQEDGTRITLGTDDVRITRLGALLRHLKLDELPQLWNVLRGDMSIVGPRPEDPKYVGLYTERERGVLRMRPGLTDAAIVGGHIHDAALLDDLPLPQRERCYREVLMPRKLRVNLEYVRDWTLRRDVSIIIRTVGLLLRVIPNRAADEVKELRDRWFMEQSS